MCSVFRVPLGDSLSTGKFVKGGEVFDTEHGFGMDGDGLNGGSLGSGKANRGTESVQGEDFAVFGGEFPVAGELDEAGVGDKVEFTPTFTVTPSPTFTPTATASAVPAGTTFSNLQISTATFYYHLTDCSPTPTQVTFQITAEDPSGIVNVEIFFRLRNKTSGGTTAWDSEVMNTRGGTRYVYTLDSSQATLASFSPVESWLLYQFIASNNVGVMTRSPVYSDITLAGCR